MGATSYVLAIDLGTTRTAAAIAVGDRSEIFELGDRAAAAPTIIAIDRDGRVEFGEGAELVAATAPDRVAREFKRRVGDTVPYLLNGVPWSIDALVAESLRWVHALVTERRQGPPDLTVATVPANWGPFKREQFAHAAELAGLAVALLTEPEAAAVHHAFTSGLAVGHAVAVYDLGGGTFDAAVVERTADGFATRGPSVGIDRLGGADFDEAIFAHALSMLELDASSFASDSELRRLREDVVRGKEALSSTTAIDLTCFVGGAERHVRLTRGEFEALVTTPLERTLVSLERAITGAGVDEAALDAIVLAGGSSRIPLVHQLVSARYAIPVTVTTHPKHAVALGAALWGANFEQEAKAAPPAPATRPVRREAEFAAPEPPWREPDPERRPEPEPEPEPTRQLEPEPEPVTVAPMPPMVDPEPAPAFELPPLDPPAPRSAGRRRAVAGVAAAVVLVAALVVAAIARSDGDGGLASGGEPTTTTAPEVTTTAPEATTTPTTAFAPGVIGTPLAAPPGDGAITFAGFDDSGAGTGVYVVFADGSGLRRIDPDIADCRQGGMGVLNRDHTQILFSPGINCGLMAVNTDGSGLRTIDTDGSCLFGCDWSPDGRTVVYELGNQIAWAAADGSQREAIADGRAPTFSTDGTFIAFNTADPQVAIFDVATRQVRVITSESGGAFYPSISPDGTTIVFGANLDPPRIVSVEGGPTVEVCPAAGGLASHPSYSRDGGRITYDADGAIRVCDLATGAVSTAAAVGHQSHSASWR